VFCAVLSYTICFCTGHFVMVTNKLDPIYTVCNRFSLYSSLNVIDLQISYLQLPLFFMHLLDMFIVKHQLFMNIWDNLDLTFFCSAWPIRKQLGIPYISNSILYLHISYITCAFGTICSSNWSCLDTILLYITTGQYRITFRYVLTSEDSNTIMSKQQPNL